MEKSKNILTPFWLILPVHYEYSKQRSAQWGPLHDFLQSETGLGDMVLGIMLDTMLRWFDMSDDFVEESMSIFSSVVENNNPDMNTDLEMYTFQKKMDFIYSDTFRLFLNLFYEMHYEEWYPHLKGFRIVDFHAQRTTSDAFKVQVLEYYKKG